MKVRILVSTTHFSGELTSLALVRCAFHIGEQLGYKVISLKLVTEREFDPSNLNRYTVRTFGIVELEAPGEINFDALKGEGHEIVEVII